MDDLIARGVAFRNARAAQLRDAKKFTPLQRAELEAIRQRHSADDIDTLLLDITFLRHALDQALDDYHETMDRLNVERYGDTRSWRPDAPTTEPEASDAG